MKKYIIILLLSVLNHHAFAQNGYDNLWLMGNNCCTADFGGVNIDFYTGSPVISSVARPINFLEQNAVISDSGGNLLFYTNGIFIYDANDSVMQNCDTLNPGACTYDFADVGGRMFQGDIIIPKPSFNNIYYLFHEGCDYSNPLVVPKRLLLTEIDMSLNGGLGAVTSNNVSLVDTPLIPGFLTGVKHANGRDWWVVAQGYNSTAFITFLVTPQGVQGPFFQNIGFSTDQPYGQTWFNRSGDRLVSTNNADINLYDFDRCSGLFSNWTLLAKPDTFIGGCAFSASSNFLYYSQGLYLYQYDLTNSNWQSTETLVATYDGFVFNCPTYFLYWVLTSDNKIYGVPAFCSTRHLHVINSPDSLLCDVQQHSIYLPKYNDSTYPNYPNYRLGKLAGSPCDTLSAEIQEDTPPSFKLYGNPVSSVLKFTSSERLKQCSVYDMLGNAVLKQALNDNNQTYTVNVGKLAQGMYFLVGETKDKRQAVIKFVKE